MQMFALMSPTKQSEGVEGSTKRWFQQKVVNRVLKHDAALYVSQANNEVNYYLSSQRPKNNTEEEEDES